MWETNLRDYIDWRNDMDKLRTIPNGAPFIFLFSGGKDTALALSIILEGGAKPIELLHCVDSENEASLFHEQRKEIVNAQASKLGIPIRYLPYKWWVRWDKIVKLYAEYRKKGVKYVAFGDLNSEGNIDFQVKLCISAGLIPCFPLCFIPYERLIKEIENRKIKSIITTINDGAIDSSFLGKCFDKEIYDRFKKLDIDPFGEAGEFHTTLVDANCFSEAIEYRYTIIDERKICIEIAE